MKIQENTLFHDRYRLIKCLGSGGFSEVWLVKDVKTDIVLALKIYAPGKGIDEDGVELFRHEFSLMFNFNHSNLLHASHYDVCDRMPYLIMPYCERGSAAKLVGNIGEEQLWLFLHDVASGLEYLHSKKPPVIHQDIKPGNVLIDDEGRYLITDFGVSAKARSTLRQSVGYEIDGGTIAYMAPERFSRNNTPVKASDVWALGATLYELITGDLPFGEHGGLIQKGGAEIPDIKTDCSPILIWITEQCLALNAWDRPTAETIVKWTEKKRIDPPDTRPKPRRLYDYVADLSDGLACVLLRGKWGYIDKTGKEVVPLKYRSAWSFSEGLATVGLNGKYGYIDQTGKEVIPLKYDTAGSFSKGFARVELNDKWGFIDKTGKEVIPFKYDNVWWFSEGLVAVALNGKWGFIDKTGNEVIPLKYDDAWAFSKGLAHVKLNGKWFYIDKNGKYVEDYPQNIV